MKKIILNLASGQTPLEIASTPEHPFNPDEYQIMTADLDPLMEPDFVTDMRDCKEIPDEFCDAVFCVHALEHVHPDEADDVMKSVLRILKPYGSATFVVPDLQKAAEVIARNGDPDSGVYFVNGNNISAADMLYGMPQLRKSEPYMDHKWGYTKASLYRKMWQAGFEQVEAEQTPICNVRCRGYKAPKEERVL